MSSWAEGQGVVLEFKAILKHLPGSVCQAPIDHFSPPAPQI